MMGEKVPLCVPNLGPEELRSVKEVLDSGWLAHGPKNEELESRFADYIGCRHAISLNSCTSALYLGIRALGITGEIILPSFTFVASANAVVTAGAVPVFADIDYDTCNIDPDSIEERISSRTEAIMPVHFAGQSCDMERIMEIANRKGLAVIEDSAEAIGACWSGRKTGSFGVGCFSFFPTKNMTTGEGGMLTTEDPGLAEKVRTLANHGIPKTTMERAGQKLPWKRAAVQAGYNFRMCHLLAALGTVQLSKLDQMNALRRERAADLNGRLSGASLDLPIAHARAFHTYQTYTVKAKRVAIRDAFVLGLRRRGIEASVHFDPPVHLQPFYSGSAHNVLPITEQVSRCIMSLPLFPGLTSRQADAIAAAVHETEAELKDL
jgi:perosamine synthetase